MVFWVFGYGSLIWKAGFEYDDRRVCFIKGYRRVFYQGSTDHRGTPEYPGRTVTLEPAEGEICVSSFYNPNAHTTSNVYLYENLIGFSIICFLFKKTPLLKSICFPDCNGWGVAYKVSKEEDEQIALTYLEVREKQYDKKAYLDVYAEPIATTPVISGVMVYIASPDKKLNRNYLGPASVEEIAKQIIHAEGPSGPNREYLFQLEQALLQMGCEDKHVMDLANEVRRILSEKELTVS
ncbi:Gamma-glutamylcyclotransferase 2-3 [Vitis vinifera]|uniref:glutathione-specific gamma-glutamylcyclotransferase n=1 Tax=Vitis vinifera TaxID=29760 RepID=A0A438KN51_VITVI|nr:Gamma-glutamylcyclotransferase 2-3 [Vitis vinifera]